MVNTKQDIRPWTSYIWDTWDKSQEERRFLHRLDTCLITYAALSYFSKYLDQQNVTNAYVSGMKEDLNLHGNQLNYIITLWTIGYVVGQIPSKSSFLDILASMLFPDSNDGVTMEFSYNVSRNEQEFLDPLRIAFPCRVGRVDLLSPIQYLISSWYKNEELAK
ncbi:hypothetical protein BC827DRAFT_644463 [Russula dissimulans]|nr:hypothetical protein BC827DRAFT_644463 [Russula dissimulans]